MGVISQASSAFGHILSDLSLVVNSFTDLSKFSAGIERLFTFLNTIQELDGNRGSLLSAPTPAKDAAKGDGAGEAATKVPEPGAIRVRETDPFLTAPPSTSTASQPIILSMRGLNLSTPDGKRVLLRNLNLSLSSGSHLLITGASGAFLSVLFSRGLFRLSASALASGAGKSSLLRAVAGLWSTGTGEIVRPTSEHVYFLPQRP